MPSRLHIYTTNAGRKMVVCRSFEIARVAGCLGAHLRVGWTLFCSLFVALLIGFQPKKPRYNFLHCFVEVDNIRLQGILTQCDICGRSTVSSHNRLSIVIFQLVHTITAAHIVVTKLHTIMFYDLNTVLYYKYISLIGFLFKWFSFFSFLPELLFDNLPKMFCFLENIKIRLLQSLNLSCGGVSFGVRYRFFCYRLSNWRSSHICLSELLFRK